MKPGTRIAARLGSLPLAVAALFFAQTTAASAATGDISTIAGLTGMGTFSGDGGLATAAELFLPSDAVPLPGGGFLIADKKNQRVRRVSRTGMITTVAGTGTNGYNGDNVPATSADLSLPTGLALLPGGGFLIADGVNDRVRKVSPAGIITTVAGNGTDGYNGDNIAATSAELDYAARVAVTPHGGFLIADFNNNRIRKVDSSGTIRTVAGDGTAASGGDGGPATSAQINNPGGVAVTPNGGFLIAEFSGHRIRRVSPSGKISTVAGTGTAGFSGNGGPATAAKLDFPSDAQPTIDGGFLIAGYNNDQVRRVSPSGVISGAAGTGTDGFSGDGGPATAALLDHPTSARALPDGGILLTDFFNDRVRQVEGAGTPAACGKRSLNVIVGSSRRNKLDGTRFADAILGRGGPDRLRGKAAADCLIGGAGRDKLIGGAGRDRLRGGKGRDRLIGGGRRDRLIGGPGPDLLKCGKGIDVAIAGPGDTVAASCELVR